MSKSKNEPDKLVTRERVRSNVEEKERRQNRREYAERHTGAPRRGYPAVYKRWRETAGWISQFIREEKEHAGPDRCPVDRAYKKYKRALPGPWLKESAFAWHFLTEAWQFDADGPGSEIEAGQGV